MKPLDVYHILLSSDTEQTPHRLEAFFDAVYAIVLTILVLGLAIPSGYVDLSPIQLFLIMLPQLFHFFLAFFILSAFWITHHRLFVLVKKVDSFLVKITFLILFTTCLLPFTSTLSGNTELNRSSVIFFDINMLILGLLFTLQWIYINKSGLTVHVPDKLYKYVLVNSLVVPGVALLACILVFINPFWSSLSYLLILLLDFLLLFIKPKIAKTEKEKINNEEGISLLIPISSSNKILTSIESVAKEMDIPKEKLILKILSRWEDEQRVKTGKDAHLCDLQIDSYE